MPYRNINDKREANRRWAATNVGKVEFSRKMQKLGYLIVKALGKPNRLQGVSKSRYAEHRGVTRQRINQLLAEGAITALGDGSIDPVAADRAIEEFKSKPTKRQTLLDSIKPGDRYGRWTVIEYAGKNSTGGMTWRVKCACGNERILAGYSFVSGVSVSCGCYRDEILREARKLNFPPGTVFGRLSVVGRVDNGPYTQSVFLCRCQCGKEKEILGVNLKSGMTRSCGCLRENCGKKKSDIPTLKQKYKREFKIFRGAKKRCNNKNDTSFTHYGGRGIKFKFASYEQMFREIGPAPSDQHTLDRINNDGHYEPGNIRWATVSEQNSNKRRCGYCPYRCAVCPFKTPVVFGEQAKLFAVQ